MARRIRHSHGCQGSPKPLSKEVHAAMMDVAVILMEFEKLPTSELLHQLAARGHSRRVGYKALSEHSSAHRVIGRDLYSASALDGYEDPTILVSGTLDLREWYDIESAGVQSLSEDNASKEGPLPIWNKRSRTLTYRGVIVLSYKKDAPNQMRALDAFEKEGWQSEIDDPLPGDPHLDWNTRVVQTAKDLNHRIQGKSIRFGACKSGRGFCWYTDDG